MSSSSGKIALVKYASAITGSIDPSAVDFVGYGAADAHEGTGAAPTLDNKTSAERKASASSTDVSLGPNGSEQRGGNGWDTNNNATDFVAQSAINPQNSESPEEPPPTIQAGIGTAAISPQLVKADTSIGVTIILRGTSEGVVTGLRFPKHPFFDWSHATIDLIPSAAGNPILRTTADSVIVTGLAVSVSDSVQVRIAVLSAPDTTLKIIFRVETGAGSDSMALVKPLPTFILYGAPRPIAVTKVNDAQGIPLNLQQPVTVRGIVTVAQQFGGPAYLQDASGGIAAFDLSFEGAVKVGDEVTITGTVTQFNGLTELSGVTLHAVNSAGNDVSPLVVTCSQIARDGANGNEVYEGMLVQLNRVTVRDTLGRPMTSWTAGSSSGANFRLFDGTDSIVVRIDGDLYNQFTIPAPSGEFDIVGVVGQFVSTPPYVGGYQLMPRSAADILSKGPVITVAPLESSITPNSFDIKWETARPGSSFARFGRTKAYELGSIGFAVQETVHRLTVPGLLPATTYHVLSFSVSGNDTSFASDRVISTASLGSTGQINVYFNKSINAALARGDTARGNANLTNLLIRRINAAQKSVDCALYSISGSVGQSIANALIQAWARGVKVRLIVERDNLSAGTGTLINQFLTPAGIPWIADDFDAVNAGVGLHHNKFFIFDYRSGSSDQTWVWTGSWNPTDPGTNDDLQNSIEIQDQALAGAYTIEFNEMWGSDSTTANRANSRFGARKLDNTPHIFNINGIPVELYFSPSDRTTSHIVSTLAKAQNSINFALLTLTRSDIAAAMKTKKDAGVKVRGILDNGTDSGSQYSFLTSNGIDVRLDPDPSALFHHKYAVIDAEVNSAHAYVITGSHNWTSAAESSNNENMLILQSNAIANQYLQEFAARYKDSGGKDNIIVGIDLTSGEPPKSFSLSQNYPNPFNGMTNFEYRVSSPGYVTLKVFDILGRGVAALVEENKAAGVYKARWDASTAPSGVYFCELRSGRFVAVKPMVLVR
jgi:phosphatidylserine/phosphatidylglycerophosphate/cardiolipin synthase-like enzyme